MMDNTNININEIQEMLNDLRSIGGAKVDDVRNIALSKKNYGSSIGFFKKEKGRKAIVFLPKTISLEFDPFTGDETEKYNSRTPFYVETGVGNFIKAMKYFLGQPENEVVLKKFRIRAKIKNWIPENPTVIDEKDIEFFDPFTRLLENYTPVVGVNCLAVAKEAMRYRVDLRRDEYGAIMDSYINSDGKVVKTPNYLKNFLMMADLHSIKANNAYNAWLDGDGANKTDTDKSSKRGEFNNAVPLSSDRIIAEYIGYAFNYEKANDQVAVLDTPEDEIKKGLFRGGIDTALKAQLTTIREVGSGLNLFPDFFVFSFTVSTQPSEQKFKGKETFKMSVSSPDSKLTESSKIVPFMAKLKEHQDANDLLKMYKASIAKYTPLLTESIVDKLSEHISNTVDVASYGLTTSQAEYFAPIISALFPTSAMQAMMEAKDDTDATKDVKATILNNKVFNQDYKAQEDENNDQVNIDVAEEDI